MSDIWQIQQKWQIVYFIYSPRTQIKNKSELIAAETY